MIFSAPFFLLTGVVAFPILIYVYRKKENLREKIVPSLFFLRNIPHSTPSSRKLKIPLRLLFELFIASLFILYLSGISLGLRSERALILVDTSLSTACTLATGESCFTSLMRALQKSLSSKFVYTIVTSSEGTPQGEDVSPPQAVEILKSLSPEYSDIPLTVKDEHFERIYVATDSKLTSKEGVYPITLEGNKKSNCALASFLNETLSIVCTKPLSRAELLIEAYDGKNLSILKSVPLILKSQKNEIPLKNLPDIGRATLKSDEDGNFLDNEIWFSNNYEKPEIAIHSPLSLSELGVASLKKYSFVNVKTPKTVAQIFHRQTNSTPDLPFLEVLPAGCKETKSSISRWETRSRVLKFLSFENFSPPTLCITPNETPLIFAQGESVASQGNNSISLGFEIFPFEGAHTPRESILLINILETLLLEQSQKLLNEKPLITSHPEIGTSKKPGIYSGKVPYNFFSESESLSLEAPQSIPSPTGSKNFSENTLYYLLISLIIILLADVLLLTRRIL